MTCFSSPIYISSFQASCYHDSQSDHFSPCSSPSALPPHQWTALRQQPPPSLKCHLPNPSQGYPRPRQWCPQPVGPCCQRRLLSPPLPRSLCTPSHASSLLRPGNQRASFLRQPHLRQNCLGCSTPGLKGLIKAKVNDTWICDLCNPEMLYSNITALAIFNHLCERSGGLHALDMVLLTIQMSQYYEGTPDIPKYIFLLEDTQHKVARAS
jgi:hypothetical protein